MTYSIVARDDATGMMGVAVQSHFLAVGAHVPWAMAGVGVVATQAVARLRYGRQALELMAAGASAAEALHACLAADDAPETRQVGVLDATGGTAVHTGARCWRFCAHVMRRGAAAQANMVASTAIPEVMLDAFEDSIAEFGARLLAALDAAQELGGDLRGRQSAALRVVSGERTEHSEDGVLIDLRVDDHLEPLTELRRVYEVHRAFERMLPAMRGPACRGPVRATPQELDSAIAGFEAAQEVYGADNLEPTFWQAVALFRAGRLAESGQLITHLRAAHPGWVTMFDHVTNP